MVPTSGSAKTAGQLVEAANEVLEDQPHLLVRHRIWVQVDVAELGDDQVQEVRLPDLSISFSRSKNPKMRRTLAEKPSM